ncbi:MAG: GntR family transcriptional regulator [Spirochaetaceae bacterium]
MERLIYDIDRMSLSDRVYFYIKDLILSGELKGGERIPEEKVASRFGLSRTPIREALRRLEEYGLIRIKPRSYAEVITLRPEEASDVAELRAAMETLAVRLLAERATDEDLVELRALCSACDEAAAQGDIAEVFEHDSDFHLAIARRSGNRHLYELFEKLDAKIQLLRLVLHLPIERVKEFIGQHHLLLEALENRDANKAVAIMRRHVLGQLEHYRPAEESASRPATKS